MKGNLNIDFYVCFNVYILSDDLCRYIFKFTGSWIFYLHVSL